MKRSIELIEQRSQVQDKIDEILSKLEKEERTITPDSEEYQQLAELRAKRDELDKAIEAAKAVEEEMRLKAQRAAQAQPQNFVPGDVQDHRSEEREKRKLRKEVRLNAIIRSILTGRSLDGAEREVVQEAEQEMRSLGLAPNGVPLPSWMVQKEQRTTLTVGTAATAGDLVATEIGEVIEYLYPATVLPEMGATLLTGLSNNFDLIRQNGPVAATWEGENDAAAESNPTVEKVAMRAKRLAAYTNVSKQFIVQSSVDAENWVRQQLSEAIGQAIEVAAINGSGTAPVPKGILNHTNIGSVAIGTNGGAPTWAAIVDLEGKVGDANALRGSLAYLTTPSMRAHMKTISKDAGSGQFLVDGNNMANGYRVFATSNVPSDLTKGTSIDCHAIIFGNWEELYIAQWGGVSLVVNPYSLDTQGIVRVTIETFADVALRHEQSFAAIKDARKV